MANIIYRLLCRLGAHTWQPHPDLHSYWGIKTCRHCPVQSHETPIGN